MRIQIQNISFYDNVMYSVYLAYHFVIHILQCIYWRGHSKALNSIQFVSLECFRMFKLSRYLPGTSSHIINLCTAADAFTVFDTGSQKRQVELPVQDGSIGLQSPLLNTFLYGCPVNQPKCSCGKLILTAPTKTSNFARTSSSSLNRKQILVRCVRVSVPPCPLLYTLSD